MEENQSYRSIHDFLERPSARPLWKKCLFSSPSHFLIVLFAWCWVVCSISLTIREMKIKTTMRYHLTPVRTVITERNTDDKCWGGWENGTLFPCWWECKLEQPPWKMVRKFLRKTKTRTPIWPGNSTPWYTPKNTKNMNSKRYMQPDIHNSTIGNCQDRETT